MRASQYIAYFFLSAIAAVLIIVGMSTLEWRTAESNTTPTSKTLVGLQKIKIIIEALNYEATEDISDLADVNSDWKDYKKGADTALSMGIIALGCIAGNVVLVALLKLCQGWTGGRARLIGIIFSLASAILIVVGTVTFDSKMSDNFKNNSKYGYSFGLYVAGGLLPFLIAVALIVQKHIWD